jgi:hypothetical protein
MSTGKCKQWVVSDESQVPDGFKQLKEYGPPRTKGKSGSPEYETLHRAYRNATIEAYKVMQSPRDKCGPVFVNASQAQSVLSTELYCGQPVQSTVAATATASAASCRHVESVCESLADIAQSLAAVERMLERLVDAAEEIASRPPKKAQPEVMQTSSSNGFHS